MKRKAEIEKAYKDCTEYMQTLDILGSETNLKAKDEVTRCAAWQEVLLWMLGPRDKETYRPFDFQRYLKESLSKETNDDIANRI